MYYSQLFFPFYLRAVDSVRGFYVQFCTKHLLNRGQSLGSLEKPPVMAELMVAPLSSEGSRTGPSPSRPGPLGETLPRGSCPDGLLCPARGPHVLEEGGKVDWMRDPLCRETLQTTGFGEWEPAHASEWGTLVACPA